MMTDKRAKKLGVHIVLDMSHSMAAIADSTISAFNEYVATLAADQPKARVSLTVFNSVETKLVYDSVKAGEVAPLTHETFVPAGMTPLLDAIGTSVAALDAAKGKNKALVIITDGHENHSVEYDKPAIKKLLDDRQDKANWLVLFLAANQDAIISGAQYGARADTSLSFAATGTGMTKGMAAAGRATRSYAASGMMADASFTTEERAAATEEGTLSGSIAATKRAARSMQPSKDD